MPKIYSNSLNKDGLDSNALKILIHEQQSKTCTYRPSLSSKEGISRNKVGVIEIAPQDIAYTNASYLH